jgi:hypothetical protein
MKYLILIIILLSSAISAYSDTRFDELDKPPEGAHRGQMFLGVFASIGLPYGDLIDAEDDFIKNNTYTFSDADTTKKMMVTHLSFSFGLSFEYMPFDRIGIKSKLKRSIIIQRSIFGSDFENKSGSLYSDYSLALGPAVHLNVRKRWDLILTPVIGYAFAEYEATPVAAQLIDDSTFNSAERKQSISGLIYGAELSMGFYFSGGLFINLGFDFLVNSIKFGEDYNITQSDGTTYSGTSSDIYNYSVILSVGYAFSN